MPNPETGVDQANPDTPLWTFDATGNLMLAGGLYTLAGQAPDGRSLVLPQAGTSTAFFGNQAINVLAFSGADPTGATDSTTAIANALAAVPNNGATVFFPPGQYKVSSTLNPAWNAILQGTGLGSQILFTGTGDCIAMSNPTTPAGVYSSQQVQSGGLRDLMIDGTNAGAGSSGLHIGNGLGYTVENVMVRNFTGSGSVGIWVDDSLWWTEKAYFRTTVANCTTCYLFSNEGATAHGSLEYSFYDMVAYWTAGQSGWVLSNTSTAHQMFWGGCWLYWRGNCNSSTPGPFLTMTGAGDVIFKRANLIFCPESNATAGTAQTIHDAGGGGNHSISNCQGWMDFGANTWDGTDMTGTFAFAGPVQGDATLAALRTGVQHPNVTTPGIPLANQTYTNNQGLDLIFYVPPTGTGVNVTVAGVPTGLSSGGGFYVRAGQTIGLGNYSIAPGGWTVLAGPYP